MRGNSHAGFLEEPGAANGPRAYSTDAGDDTVLLEDTTQLNGSRVCPTAVQWSLALMLAYVVVCVSIVYLCGVNIAATTAVPVWLAPRTYLRMRSALRSPSGSESSSSPQLAGLDGLVSGLGILLVGVSVDFLVKLNNFVTGERFAFVPPYNPTAVGTVFLVLATIVYLFVNAFAPRVQRPLGTATEFKEGSAGDSGPAPNRSVRRMKTKCSMILAAARLRRRGHP